MTDSWIVAVRVGYGIDGTVQIYNIATKENKFVDIEYAEPL